MCCNDKKSCCCSKKPNAHECTPEQIRECHGEGAEHPCAQQDQEAAKK